MRAVRRGIREGWIGGLAVVAVGTGSSLLLAGGGAGRLGWAVAGGGVAAVGLAVLLSAGWVQRLAVLALALPLPAVYSTPELRVAPALLVTALVVGAWLADPRTVLSRLRGLPWAGAALLWAGTATAALVAGNRGAALRETVSLTLLLLLLVVAVHELRRGTGRMTTLIRALATAGALAGAFAVLEAAGLIPGRFPLAVSAYFRATGGFGWPNEMGLYLALSFPFAVHLLRHGGSGVERALGGVAVAAVVLGLVATFSRGSWLTTLVAPAVLLLAGRARGVWTGWLVAALGIAVLDLAGGGLVSDRIAAAFTDTSAAQRLGLMAAGILMFQANPILGVGPGGFGDALDRFGFQVPGLWDFVGSAHNAYIHVAAETGVLGLLGLVILLAAVGVRILGASRRLDAGGSGSDAAVVRTVLWAFSVVCVAALFEWIFAQGPGQLVVLVIAMGIVAPGASEGPDKGSREGAAP